MSERIILCPICGYPILPRESGVEMPLGSSNETILVCKDCDKHEKKEEPNE